jgi:hypothetical protein
MKQNRNFMHILPVIMILVAVHISQALPPLDYGNINEPKFKGVDVVISTEWNTTEETKDVDVVEIKDQGKMYGLMLVKNFKSLAELTLVSGVEIKIFDHESGKLLHSYKLHH